MVGGPRGNRRDVLKSVAVGTGIAVGVPLATRLSQGHDCPNFELRMPSTPQFGHTLVSPGTIVEDVFSMATANTCTDGNHVDSAVELSSTGLSVGVVAEDGSAVAVSAGWIDVYNANPRQAATVEMELELLYAMSGSRNRADDSLEQTVRSSGSPAGDGSVPVIESDSSRATLGVDLEWLGLESLLDDDGGLQQGAGVSWTVMETAADGRFDANSNAFQEQIVTTDWDNLEGSIEQHDLIRIPDGPGAWEIPPESHARILFAVGTGSNGGTSVVADDTGLPGLSIEHLSYNASWD